MNALIILITILMGAQGDGYKDFDVGIGTVFKAKDEGNPNPHLACESTKILDDKSLVVAHRTLPCKTKVRVCNLENLKCTDAVVMDRGPYGLTKDCKTCKERHTSILDMSSAVQNKIEHNGFEKILLLSPIEINKKKIIKRKRVRLNA